LTDTNASSKPMKVELYLNRKNKHKGRSVN
jgi:hypothetical protein